MRPNGVFKRSAEHVPSEHRKALNSLSKADLMEVAYSFALMIEGEDAPDAAFDRVVREYETLCANYGRKPVRVQRRDL